MIRMNQDALQMVKKADILTRPTLAYLSHPPTLRLLRNRSPETRLSTGEIVSSEETGARFSVR
jgi:hypothetical protein